METNPELWCESKTLDQYELLGAMIRQELKKETVRRIDMSYLGHRIDSWWYDRRDAVITKATLSNLRGVILEAINPEHLETMRGIGSTRTRVSAVLMERTFSIADKALARLVHEAMAEIAGLIDIKYPYEEHKELFPVTQEGLESDWGKGLGIIRPHSDDLYEDRAVNAMCLTVCRDTSSTPTWFWLLKDIVSCLSDRELGVFALSEAAYLSGKNVEGKIEVRKSVLRRDPEEGIGMRIDFRIDGRFGPRMKLLSEEAQVLFDKIRASLRELKPISSNPSTGSVAILSNYKVLHGRSALNPVMLYEGETSRILFRSKGMKECSL